jgi:hypothetical protein
MSAARRSPAGRRRVAGLACIALAAVVGVAARVGAAASAVAMASATPAAASPPVAAAAGSDAWFQSTEQALMDAIGVGDRTPWQRAIDPAFVLTSEEGEVLDGAHLLDSLRGLPAGLSGSIAVRELTVSRFAGTAIVRFLADEKETVFGQQLATRYRITDVWRADGEAWRLVASHVSVVTQDPPAQPVSSAGWERLVGSYRLLPGGWTFTVELKDGRLWGGRDPAKLRPFVPLAPDVFVLSGGLGEWIFVADASGKVSRLVDFRKFEPLVWTRVAKP